MTIEIKHRYSGAVLFTSNTAIDLAGAVKEALRDKADLCFADLRSADLCSANLRSADLRSAKNADYTIAQTRILPEGDLIGWKKLANGVIAKLRIPEAAKRSHAFGRKCRAEYAIVIEGEGFSQYDSSFKYTPGETVRPDIWDDDWTRECAGGVHFFITKAEAENY